MEITFGPVRRMEGGERFVEVYAAGRCIGEIYREPEMIEWAANAELESVGFENANGRTLALIKRDILERQREREERFMGAA